MDSEMPYFLVWSLSSSAWCIMRYILYILVLSLIIFMQSLYPLSEIFHLLVSFHFFYCFLEVRVIERNNNFLCSLHR